MPEPAAPPPVDAPRPKGVLRPRLWFVLAAIAAVLAGRGLGWFGGGQGPVVPPAAVPADLPAVASPPPPPPRKADGVASGGGAAATPAPGPASSAPPAAAPSGEPPSTPPAAVPAPPAAAPVVEPAPAAVADQAGVDADRLHTLLSLVASRRAAGELGAALAAVQRAAALPLAAAQREAVQQAQQQVDGAWHDACERLQAALAEGRVLLVAAVLDDLLRDADAAFAARCAEQLQLAGGALDRAPAAGPLPWPVAAPLPRDRGVRTRLAGAEVTGRVVDGRADQVTLRVETEHGVTFPTVPVVQCEPTVPTADEAVEQGFAALQAGQPRLARLWLAAARRIGATAATPRAERLAQILQ
ncbi:MAG: hypothetical protein JNL08_14050 [Planctomycetes bacterium]|nr:hypothetical protein [Planctomycetota bacterium]